MRLEEVWTGRAPPVVLEILNEENWPDPKVEKPKEADKGGKRWNNDQLPLDRSSSTS